MVGTNSGDDAAVWQLDTDRALVLTVDFITPVVDDAYTWGQIATANAVSDIYAMGATPILSLNLVSWNDEELPSSLLVEVLKGGSDKASEGNWLVVGGHSIQDREPKYGMCVIGEVHPGRILSNSALRPGDHLILTKPLGVGVLTTAIKNKRLDDEFEKNVISSMSQLNNTARDVALKFGATGATDITGFGLLGHLKKMLDPVHLDAKIQVGQVRLLQGSYELAKQGVSPSGSRRNLDWVKPILIPDEQDDVDLILLADAQTSGGLLFGVEEKYLDEALSELTTHGVTASAIGKVSRGSGKIYLSKGHISSDITE